jgi:tRNA(fMet)-specific endonuclease VapC
VSGRVVVDSNVVIALFAGDPDIAAYVSKCSELYLCVPVLGELWYGALASSRVNENIQRLQQFATTLMLLHCDSGTATQFGTIKFALRKKGRPIPDNDIWIAAIAQQHGLRVISRDSHFAEIDNLDLDLL